MLPLHIYFICNDHNIKGEEIVSLFLEGLQLHCQLDNVILYLLELIFHNIHPRDVKIEQPE